MLFGVVSPHRMWWQSATFGVHCWPPPTYYIRAFNWKRFYWTSLVTLKIWPASLASCKNAQIFALCSTIFIYKAIIYLKYNTNDTVWAPIMTFNNFHASIPSWHHSSECLWVAEGLMACVATVCPKPTRWFVLDPHSHYIMTSVKFTVSHNTHYISHTECSHTSPNDIMTEQKAK